MSYKNKKILGVITARGGSKGIPGKNIKLLAGKPLIAHTIEQAKQSQFLTRTIVSTDSEEIMGVAKQFGADVPFQRPAELAQDDTPHVPVLKHALQWLKENENQEFDYLVNLHPTSPFRTAEDIDNCIKKAVDTGADSVVSVIELANFSLKKLKKIENDLILPLMEEEGGTAMPRQQVEKVYKRNAAIYVTKADLILQEDMYGKVCRPYLMPESRSLDIDEPYDFELAECWMKKIDEKNKNV